MKRSSPLVTLLDLTTRSQPAWFLPLGAPYVTRTARLPTLVDRCRHQPRQQRGPLLNIEGVLIGINTAVDTRAEGIGFAIPINKARRVMLDLMSAGRVAPLWLGLDLQDVDGRTALGLGRGRRGLVTAVFPGSPAAKAGIVPGDE